MILSVYATDEADVRDAVVDQALQQHERALFTSLHMPEATDLAGWVGWLENAHCERGVSFWADVSPAAFDLLGYGPDDAGRLAGAGVVGLRLDYGYGPEEIGRIASATGLPVAVNASTATAAEVDALQAVLGDAPDALVGWHNFYPRPGTGLTAEDLVRRSRLFTDRGLRVLAFVAGDVTHRAPLHLGLPTLEAHRHRNAYVCALELDALVPGVSVVGAEGVVAEQHLRWIADALPDGDDEPVLTLPVTDLQPGCDWLLDEWDLRPEAGPASRRLTGTRGSDLPAGTVPADALEAGSLQMDTLGRYSGEVHLMTATAPLDGQHLRLADVAAPYRSLLAHLDRFDRVRLVRA